jgi:hypothetical protein
MLLDVAQAGTANHVERFVRAWRRGDRAAAAQHADARHLQRHLSTWVDDDGMVVIRGRLTPEVGAVVQRALEAAADRLFRDAQGTPTAERLTEEVTPAQRRADALGRLAEAALSADLDRGSAGDRYQVVLHVDGTTAVAAGEGLAGTLEVDHGAVDVSAETSKRLCCDAAVVPMVHGDDDALDVGRKTRTVPPLIRRALQARDRSCRFPGCTARRCDTHHVEHWVDGGATSLDNLVLLCRRHHRSMHEGGFAVSLSSDGTAIVRRPDGSVLEAAPTLPPPSKRLDFMPREPDDIPVWDGTPFDPVYAIDVLYAPRAPRAPAMPGHQALGRSGYADGSRRGGRNNADRGSAVGLS